MDDPASKYADKVSPEHVMAMQAVGFMRVVLEPQRAHFEELLRAERDMHSVGAILDPTLYRDMIHSKWFERQMKLVRAALTFLRETDEVVEEIKAA